MAWQDKVKEAIAAQCLAEYKACGKTWAQNKGRMPYRVPELAGAMIAALNEDDETEGKRLLMIYRTGALSLV